MDKRRRGEKRSGRPTYNVTRKRFWWFGEKGRGVWGLSFNLAASPEGTAESWGKQGKSALFLGKHPPIILPIYEQRCFSI